MNRNYDKRPTQGFGRSAHDYGNTHLDDADQTRPMVGIAVGVALGVLLFAWIAAWWVA